MYYKTRLKKEEKENAQFLAIGFDIVSFKYDCINELSKTDLSKAEMFEPGVFKLMVWMRGCIVNILNGHAWMSTRNVCIDWKRWRNREEEGKFTGAKINGCGRGVHETVEREYVKVSLKREFVKR